MAEYRFCLFVFYLKLYFKSQDKSDSFLFVQVEVNTFCSVLKSQHATVLIYIC